MATKNTPVPMLAKNVDGGLPASWGNSEVMEGLDLLDKAELVNKPFRMTGYKFDTGARDIAYVYVEAELIDGTKVQFNDSSSGVRAQVEAYAQAHPDKKADDRGWVDVSIVAPRGLRVSHYDVVDDRGAMKKAKTYYITTSGTRA